MGRVASADSFGELGDVVRKWGYDGTELAKTLEAFNARMTGPDAAGTPGRRWNRRMIDVPPFTAIEVKGGITFTQGGLRVDTNARVLNAVGSHIGGLFAAGADIGGVYDGGYAGGLALASVYGIAAAKAALTT